MATIERFTRRTLIVLMLALVMLAGGPWRSRAATNRFVAVGGSDTANDCTNSSQPCATIQHAVDQSGPISKPGPGDLIELGPGTYFENVDVSQSVTIQGDVTLGSTVNGNNSASVFTVGSLTATLIGLTITNGNAGDPSENSGGGINNFGTLTVIGCTITGNRATSLTTIGRGGGIFNQGGPNGLMVINSTISGNTAPLGGGIYNPPPDVATVVNSTISGNSGILGGGILNGGTATLNLRNTIIAGSLGGGDCVNQGTIATNVNNLIQDGSCTPALSGDPKLGPLQNNGGPTFTRALLPGSPAIDAGDDSVLGAPLFLTTDQRGPGFPRKSGPHVDIGAFEVQFDTCLKDNTTGNLLQWNRTTGAYKFTRCSDGFMLTGTGLVKLVNGIQTLTDFKSDRRISAGLNTGQLTGNATLYLMVTGGVWQTIGIVDTNPAAVCACPG